MPSECSTSASIAYAGLGGCSPSCSLRLGTLSRMGLWSRTYPPNPKGAPTDSERGSANRQHPPEGLLTSTDGRCSPVRFSLPTQRISSDHHVGPRRRRKESEWHACV